ncbi:MAG: putative membrane protein YdjX (TVP38/TMEM64 family) [Planctomycetota bacterium]|jgi:uncharacterized membrane protein YdjX (TVP38/TMEM64 family)
MVATAVSVALFFPLGEWVDSFATWGAERGVPGALLVGLLFVPVCLLMLPASSALAYAMALAFGLWASFAGVMFGAVLGAMACFLAGRYYARGFVERHKQNRPMLAALDTVLDERSFGMIALVRLSPLFPYALVGYALGATRITFWRHALATTLAIAPQTLLTCYIGSTVGDLATGGEAEPRSPMEYAMLAAGILAAFLVIGVISKRTKAALEVQLSAPAAADGEP